MKNKGIHFKGATSEVNNAPAGHAELVKNSRKNLKKAPKDKYYCSVYFGTNLKEQFQIRKPNKTGFEASKKRWSKHYTEFSVTFSEIKPIMIK